MASRNTDGTEKLQLLVNRAIRNTGDVLAVGESSNDTVIERISNAGVHDESFPE